MLVSVQLSAFSSQPEPRIGIFDDFRTIKPGFFKEKLNAES
jgi:hypothetical protein